MSIIFGMKKTHVDLFSGIGGFALACRWAGIETVQFVEIDKFCQKVLRKNFPGVPIYDDIKTLAYAKVREDDTRNGGILDEKTTIREGSDSTIGTSNQPIFLLTGGVPCQPASIAGKRRGRSDDRWLWPEAIRCLSEIKPVWAILENPAGILSLEGGVVFEDLLFEMEIAGYQVWPVIIPACAVNAPHRRDRVWIVAHSESRRDASRIQDRSGKRESALSLGNNDSHAPDTDNPTTTRQREHSRSILRITESERLDIPSWQEPWIEVATRLCRVDDGVSRKLDRVNRLKALGNSIVPQVAYEIITGILEIDIID